jgi:hypothetical protein
MENVQERKWNKTEIDWDLVISNLNEFILHHVFLVHL